MKLEWCPETASNAYTAAVNTLSDGGYEETDVAVLVSAMAGGWRAKLIVEVWASGGGPATSLGLASAARHTDGRNVCIVPDQQSAVEYEDTMRQAGGTAAVIMVGEAELVMKELEGVEMMVVDLHRRDAVSVMSEARAGLRGMVVVCKSDNPRTSVASLAVRAGTRVVRSAFVPVGRGAEIFHVGVGKGPRAVTGRRWIKHVDRDTGEEHLFRR